jgi:hypothetical protein
MPVRKVKASTKPSGASRAGNYVFRFNGFTMANDTPYYLVGLGKFVLDASGNLTGTQTSSITQIAGQGASLSYASNTLTGTWNIGEDGTGTAKIKFTSKQQTMTGTFDLVAVGDTGRIWMISTGATVQASKGLGTYLADEVNHGEAIKVG